MNEKAALAAAEFMGEKATKLLAGRDVFRPLLEHGEQTSEPEAPESPFEEAPEGDL